MRKRRRKRTTRTGKRRSRRRIKGRREWKVKRERGGRETGRGRRK